MLSFVVFVYKGYLYGTLFCIQTLNTIVYVVVSWGHAGTRGSCTWLLGSGSGKGTRRAKVR